MIRGCLTFLGVLCLVSILVPVMAAIFRALPVLVALGVVFWIASALWRKSRDNRQSGKESERTWTTSSRGTGEPTYSQSGKGWQWEEQERHSQEEARRRERERSCRQERERQRRREQEEKNRREREQRHRRERDRQRRREQEDRNNGGRERERRAGQGRSAPRSEDFYVRLGVNANATEKEIKSAWKEFAQQWHPDVCKHFNAKTVFQLGSEAYNVLSVPDERSKYDAQLRSQNQEQYQRPRTQGNSAASQGRSQGPRQRAPRTAQQDKRSQSAQRARRGGHGHSWNSSGRLFSGTWTKIRRGPLTGTWGVWIDSLYVMEGEKALIARQDGHQTLVVIVQILRRSRANRVTLCRVQNLRL